MSHERAFSARRARRLLTGERQMFVAVNVAINLVFLARSYITMQVLDYRGLGLAALLQTVILIVGALQLGFLNGGFRLICAAEGREAERINNLLYTFFSLVLCVSLAVGAAVLAWLDGGDADMVALLGIGGGVLTLVRTWMVNRMVAAGALVRLNAINMFSAVASMLPLLFIPVDPLIACLAAVVAQPLVFVLAVAAIDSRQLPSGFEADRTLLKAVLRAGFILFLTAIFLQLNTVFERWYVTAELGVDALGHLYLAILFVTLFQLVPTSLDQLYLPAIVRSNNGGDHVSVSLGVRQFLVVTAAYCTVASIAIAFAAAPVTALILPEYVPDLRYVYLLAPGLIVFTLTGPFAIMFNTLIRYRYFLIAYGAGTAVTAGIFAAAAVGEGFLGLDGVVLLRSAVYVLMSAILMGGYLAISREFPQFRPGFHRRVGARG